MNCAEVQDNLSAYLDEVLDPDEHQAVASHLLVCPDCREELKTLRETIQLLHSLGDVEPPPGFHQQLHARLQAKTSRLAPEARKFAWFTALPKSRWFSAGMAAAVFFVVVSVGSLVAKEAGMFPLWSHDASQDLALTSEMAPSANEAAGDAGGALAGSGRERHVQLWDSGGAAPFMATDELEKDGTSPDGSFRIATQGDVGERSVPGDSPEKQQTKETAKAQEQSVQTNDAAGNSTAQKEINSSRSPKLNGIAPDAAAAGGLVLTDPLPENTATWSAMLNLNVASVEEAAAGFKSLVAELGGVVERTVISGKEGTARTGSFRARVPGTDAETIAARFSSLGKTVQVKVAQEEIGTEYATTLDRLKALEQHKVKLETEIENSSVPEGDAALRTSYARVCQEIVSEQEHMFNLQRLLGMTVVVLEVSETEAE